MARLSVLTLGFALLALGGCASNDVGPTPAELKARWEAENVYPEGYKRDLLAFLRTYLNEPSGVRGAAVSAPERKDVGPGERFVTCVRYNERQDGRYAGPKDGVAVFVSGKLDRFFDVPREVREICKDAVFAPFPELEALKR
jgi:hypothetical protein